MSNSSVVPLFKNRTNANVVLEDGTLIGFANKQYYTHDKRIIDRLSKAAERGEFGIYIDPAESDIDLEAATPMERLRKQIREELLAEQRAGKVAGAAATTSTQAPIASNVASTVSTAPEQQNQQLSDLNKSVPTETTPPAEPTKELSALEKLKANAAGNQSNS